MAITIKQLNAKINAIAKTTAKWRDEVQLILVGCAQHAYDDGNVDPCTKLVHALTGADARAIIHWIEEHMPAVWVKAEDKFRFNKSHKGEYDAVVLMAEAWWELATMPKNVSSSLDCLDAVRQLVKRLEKEIASGTKTVAHAEIVAKLSALTNEVEFAESK